MFDPGRAVLVAADSWEKLRLSDVFRLFNSHSEEQWSGIMRVLKQKRPELVAEAVECLSEIRAGWKKV